MTQSKLKEICEYTNDGLLLRTVRINGRGKPIGSKLGSTDGKGYLSVQINNKQYKVHRLVWLYHYGSFPKNNIDHINGNRSDNRIENLRDVSYSDNSKNMTLDKRSKTGVTGVLESRSVGKYEVSIGVDGSLIHLGTFGNIEAAIEARKEAEIKYGFHTNHGKDKF